MFDTPKRSGTQGYTLTEIFDRTFRIYRQNFLPFFVLSCVIQIPLLIINTLVLGQESQSLLNSGVANVNPAALSSNDAMALLGSVMGFYLAIFVLALISALLTGILIQGPIVFIASENHLGRTATLRDGLMAVRKRLSALSIGLILFYAILVVMSIALTFALFLCGLGVGLLFYVSLVLGSMLVPVLLLERTDLRMALGRSWTLGKSRVWVLLAISVGLNILSILVTLILTFVFTQLFRNSTSPLVKVLITILGSLGGLALLPLTPIALTEFYYDLRNRFEGLDIALKSVATPNPSPADVPSPAPGPLLANEDYLNIALFAIGTLVVVLIAYFAFASILGTRIYGL